jgi:predicted Zn-dependent peptidase
MVYSIDANLARGLVESEYFGEDLLDFPARSKAILGVTREDLNRVARRYYDPALFHFGLAGALPQSSGGFIRPRVHAATAWRHEAAPTN